MTTINRTVAVFGFLAAALAYPFTAAAAFQDAPSRGLSPAAAQNLVREVLIDAGYNADSIHFSSVTRGPDHYPAAICGFVNATHSRNAAHNNPGGFYLTSDFLNNDISRREVPSRVVNERRYFVIYPYQGGVLRDGGRWFEGVAGPNEANAAGRDRAWISTRCTPQTRRSEWAAVVRDPERLRQPNPDLVRTDMVIAESNLVRRREEIRRLRGR